MKTKRGEAAQKEKRFSKRKLALVSTILAALIIGGVLLSRFFWLTSPAEFSFRAAIVDQLSSEFPNGEYNMSGTVPNTLKEAGFNVSYFGSESVNVAFYKGLATYNYGIIILRTHSAQREAETIVDLFTSERFDTGKYDSELENGLVTVGYYSWNRSRHYFTIPPKFIESLTDNFPKSIVIAMGCNTLNATCTEMAEAFIKKGAVAYVGWTGMVVTSHTDIETIKLLHGFLNESKTLDQAVRATEPDPDYSGSKMTYYPHTAGNLTLSSLRTEKKTSMVLQDLVGESEFSLQVCETRAWPIRSKALRIELSQAGLLGA
jgi:hypothetical protein